MAVATVDDSPMSPIISYIPEGITLLFVFLSSDALDVPTRQPCPDRAIGYGVQVHCYPKPYIPHWDMSIFLRDSPNPPDTSRNRNRNRSKMQEYGDSPERQTRSCQHYQDYSAPYPMHSPGKWTNQTCSPHAFPSCSSINPANLMRVIPEQTSEA